jgi:hypothetical protein
MEIYAPTGVEVVRCTAPDCRRATTHFCKDGTLCISHYARKLTNDAKMKAAKEVLRTTLRIAKDRQQHIKVKLEKAATDAAECLKRHKARAASFKRAKRYARACELDEEKQITFIERYSKRLHVSVAKLNESSVDMDALFALRPIETAARADEFRRVSALSAEDGVISLAIKPPPTQLHPLILAYVQKSKLKLLQSLTAANTAMLQGWLGPALALVSDAHASGRAGQDARARCTEDE